MFGAVSVIGLSQVFKRSSNIIFTGTAVLFIFVLTLAALKTRLDQRSVLEKKLQSLSIVGASRKHVDAFILSEGMKVLGPDEKDLVSAVYPERWDYPFGVVQVGVVFRLNNGVVKAYEIYESHTGL